MPGLAALPQEILLHIVSYIDDVDQNEGTFAIFEALRINRIFRDLAIEIYFDKRPRSHCAAARYFCTQHKRDEDAALDAKIAIMKHDEKTYRWAHETYRNYLACNPGRRKVEAKARKYDLRHERKITETGWL